MRVPFLVLLVAALCPPVWAQGNPNSPQPENPTGADPVAPPAPSENVGKPIAGATATGFGQLDGDHDGRISLTEAKASTELAARFGQFDADGDGSLSLEEYEAFGREAR